MIDKKIDGIVIHKISSKKVAKIIWFQFNTAYALALVLPLAKRLQEQDWPWPILKGQQSYFLFKMQDSLWKKSVHLHTEKV